MVIVCRPIYLMTDVIMDDVSIIIITTGAVAVVGLWNRVQSFWVQVRIFEVCFEYPACQQRLSGSIVQAIPRSAQGSN